MGNDESGSRKAERTTSDLFPPITANMTCSAAASVGIVNVKRRQGGLGEAASTATHLTLSLFLTTAEK